MALGVLSCSEYEWPQVQCLTYLLDLDNPRSVFFKKKLFFREFPGGPVVRTPRFHCRGTGSSLVRELRSRMLCSTAEKFFFKFKLRYT